MAKCARSAPLRESSTGIDASSSLPVPTRRGLLTIAAGAAVVAGSALPVAAASRDRRWDRLRAQFEAAREAMQHYEDTTYRPAADYIERTTGKGPPCYVELLTPYSPKPARIWVFNHIPDHPAYEPAKKAKAALEAWQGRVGRAEHEVDFTSIDKRMSELDQAEYAARDRLMDEPAPDLAALAYKLNLALEGEEVRGDHHAILKRDAARLV